MVKTAGKARSHSNRYGLKIMLNRDVYHLLQLSSEPQGYSQFIERLIVAYSATPEGRKCLDAWRDDQAERARMRKVTRQKWPVSPPSSETYQDVPCQSD